MVLRDASGLVVDSLNYGGLVDPWAAEGYQATSGVDESGCYVAAPGLVSGERPRESGGTSAGRLPDGRDTDSNCTDFVTAPATALAASSAAGATNLKVAGVKGFSVGQKIRIGAGAKLETAKIAEVGTPGATTVREATDAGTTVLPVASVEGFGNGQTIAVGSGTNAETAVIASMQRFRTQTITVSAPLTHAHTVGAQISGTGIMLTAPLVREHSSGSPVEGSPATPGAPNQYEKRQR